MLFREVGLIPTISHALLAKTGDHAPLDRYTLKILDRWQAEENVDAYEQQYLRSHTKLKLLWHQS